MNQTLTRCPVCASELTLTRLHCESCDTTIEGRFHSDNPFAPLSAEQRSLLLSFIRNDGKINRMESELKLSYPTIRNRLNELIRALGYEPSKEESPEPVEASEERRRQVLEDLDNGKISAAEAMRLLRGEEA